MNLDQRQSELAQTPTGRGLTALLDRAEPGGVENLAESPDRFAELQGNVEHRQDESQVQNGTTALGDTQPAGAGHFGNGVPGPNRLQQLSAECDHLLVPESVTVTRNMAVGISLAVLAGVLVCLLAFQFLRNSTADLRLAPIPPKPEVAEVKADPPEVVPAEVKINPPDTKAQEPAQEPSPAEKPAVNSDSVAPKKSRGKSPAKSTPHSRLKTRLAPGVLYRLELSQEQASRIRTILERCSKDLPFAEAQIRGLLTEEQNRRWESISP